MYKYLELLISQGFDVGEEILAPTVTPETGGEFVGGVAQIISAVLQTAGVFAHAEVLRNFSGIFESFGALVFVVVLFFALITFAIHGSYKDAAYLLMGPALFYFIYNTRVPVEGTQLRFGTRVSTDFVEDYSIYQTLVAGLPNAAGPHEASWFYVQFDKIVSEVVHNFVGLLVDTENNQDIQQAALERVFHQVLSPNSEVSGYSQLVAGEYLGKCSDVSTMARQLTELGDSPQHSSQAEVVRARYTALNNTRNRSLQGSTIEYLGTMSPTAQDAAACGTNSTGILSRVLSEPSPVLSCQEIWQLGCLGAMQESREVVTRDISPDPGAAISQDVDWDEVAQDLFSTIGGEGGEEQGREVVASNILRSTLRMPVGTGLTDQVMSHLPMNSIIYEGAFDTVYQIDARSRRASIVAFAAWIPYLQGLLLYLLSIAFPFFALLLLVPGRWTSFFIWMSLWVWVKCWDIGFAVIVFIKMFLWNFMQHGNYAETDIDLSQAPSVYRSLYENDPIASLNTYYSIISLLTLSVPAITAHFCNGAHLLERVFGRGANQPGNAVGTNYQKARRLLDGTIATEGTGRVYNNPRFINATVRAAAAEAANYDPSIIGADGQFVGTGDGTNARRVTAAGQVAMSSLVFDRAGDGIVESNRIINAMLTGRNDPYFDRASSEALAARHSASIERFTGSQAGNPLDTRTADDRIAASLAPQVRTGYAGDGAQ